MRRLAALAAAAALAGCLGSTDPVPPDNFYRLRVATAGEPAQHPTVPGVLQVSALEGDALLHARPVLYSPAGQPHAVRQHNYHYWADPPTRMVQDELAAYLKKRGAARSIVTPSMRVESDYELRGRLRRLELVTGGRGARVIAELDLSVVRVADDRVVVAGSYEREIAAEDDAVATSVAALNEALADIFAKFSADLDRAPALAEAR
jgi:ABC-type uncharacterized transport system auxiliary subunit